VRRGGGVPGRPSAGSQGAYVSGSGTSSRSRACTSERRPGTWPRRRSSTCRSTRCARWG